MEKTSNLIELIIAVILICYILYLHSRHKRFLKVSKKHVMSYYKKLLLEKVYFLQSKQREGNYLDILKSSTRITADELAHLPKDMRSWIWDDVVSEHDKTQPRAIGGDGVWGRALFYNKIKGVLKV